MRLWRHPRKRLLFIVGFLILPALLIAVCMDYRLTVTSYKLIDLRLPQAFDGFKVVQVSDLHGAVFGAQQSDLIKAIEKESPDIIVLTGDIIDRSDTSLEPISALLEGVCDIAPIYSVSGNHEVDNVALYPGLNALYASYGVTVLENRIAELRRDNACIYIGGIDMERDSQVLGGKDTALSAVPAGAFGILLYHASTQYEEIVDLRWNYSYVFSGHTHGGIVRIPFAGGLIDNEMTLFPRYTGGLFNDMKPALISSRGLGDASSTPIPRVNNRPELVSVTFFA